VGPGRYKRQRHLDTTFGTGGRVITDLNNGTYGASINSMSLLPDGRVVTAGASGGFSSVSLARYTAAGVLDSTFNGGQPIIDNSISRRLERVGPQSDGKVVVAGSAHGSSGSDCTWPASPPQGTGPTFGFSAGADQPQ